jgi:methionyl aminopeptidase
VSVDTPEELEALKAAGRVVADALAAMRRGVRPGVSTRELDRVAARVFGRAGARSGPQLDYGFPGVTCISVNDEAVHGIPGPRRLAEGDLVKLDVTAELDGFYADACPSMTVGRGSVQSRQLVAAARSALARALEVARQGVRLNAIGATVQREVESRGFSVCTELMGHRIGRRIHEPPHVPNRYLPGFSQRLRAGLVMTIEPIISAGTGHVKQTGDGWTVRTADRALSAHAEHTIVLTGGRPILLTA